MIKTLEKKGLIKKEKGKARSIELIISKDELPKLGMDSEELKVEYNQEKEIKLIPIGYVKNNRKMIKDDNWGEVVSEIFLKETIIEESLNGIEDYSHLDIIFYMDKVKNEKAIAQFRHPRNIENIPKSGTYAQRNKNRPNKLGLTTVTLIERKGNSIKVSGLDAIDGTPILDIKPVMEEFEPKGEIRQPNWIKEIMKDYWK